MNNNRCVYTYNSWVKHIGLVFLKDSQEVLQTGGIECHS